MRLALGITLAIVLGGLVPLSAGAQSLPGENVTIDHGDPPTGNGGFDKALHPNFPGSSSNLNGPKKTVRSAGGNIRGNRQGHRKHP